MPNHKIQGLSKETLMEELNRLPGAASVPARLPHRTEARTAALLAELAVRTYIQISNELRGVGQDYIFTLLDTAIRTLTFADNATMDERFIMWDGTRIEDKSLNSIIEEDLPPQIERHRLRFARDYDKLMEREARMRSDTLRDNLMEGVHAPRARRAAVSTASETRPAAASGTFDGSSGAFGPFVVRRPERPAAERERVNPARNPTSLFVRPPLRRLGAIHLDLPRFDVPDADDGGGGRDTQEVPQPTDEAFGSPRGRHSAEGGSVESASRDRHLHLFFT